MMALAQVVNRATTQLNLGQLRAQSPGADRCIHLNAAGASLMPEAVLQALHAHLDREGEQGGYDAAYAAQSAIDAFYSALAQLIGARPEQLAFVDSGSRAWAMALCALPFPSGSRLLLTDCEYLGNWQAARWIARARGWRLEVVPVVGDAAAELARALERPGGPVRLLASVHVPSNNGLVVPVESLGATLRERSPETWHLVDVCQSVGQLPVDVQAMNADLLVGTGRKYLRGPRGSAFLYVGSRPAAQLRPAFLDTFSARGESELEPWPGARCFETWECYVGGKIGLGAAASYLLSLDQPAVTARIRGLAGALRSALSAVPGVRVLELGVAGCSSGLVTFEARGREPRELWRALTARGFRLDTCQVSGSLLAPHLPAVHGVLRASVHYYTLEHELEAFVQTLSDMMRMKI